MVSFQPGGEPVQVGQVDRFDRLDPGVEAFAAAAGEHLGETGHVPGEGIEVRAAGADVLERDLLVAVEVVGVAQQPADNVSHLGGAGAGGGAAPSGRNGRTYSVTGHAISGKASDQANTVGQAGVGDQGQVRRKARPRGQMRSESPGTPAPILAAVHPEPPQ